MVDQPQRHLGLQGLGSELQPQHSQEQDFIPAPSLNSRVYVLTFGRGTEGEQLGGTLWVVQRGLALPGGTCRAERGVGAAPWHLQPWPGVPGDTEHAAPHGSGGQVTRVS